MNISFWLNGVNCHEEVEPDTLLIDLLRKKGCLSVKRGCETANCGLCTVLMDDRAVLSCSTLAARIEGKKIVTLEGMQREAKEFGSFIANEGAEQCGFCYYECFCHAQRNQGTDRRTDQRISGRKSLQMFRFCFSDICYS